MLWAAPIFKHVAPRTLLDFHVPEQIWRSTFSLAHRSDCPRCSERER